MQVQLKNIFNKQIKVRVKLCLIAFISVISNSKNSFLSSSVWSMKAQFLSTMKLSLSIVLYSETDHFLALKKLQINIQTAAHVSAFCLWDSTQHFISEWITISLHAHKWNAIRELRQPLWLLEKSIFTELSQAFACERDEWNYILFLLLCVVEHDGLSSV